MDAREIESLSMLSRGFSELKEANPELAYNVVLDILQGINEYVFGISLSLYASLLKYLAVTLPLNNIYRHLIVSFHTNASFVGV
jgi:hypothetical protein